MTFPTEPTVPLPTWANDTGAVKVDPGDTRRAEGWKYAGPGLQYGEAPPFPWVNNEAYNNGEWATYFKQGFDYINAGNLKEKGIYFPRIIPTNMVNGSNIIFPVANYYNVPGIPNFYNTTTGVFTAPITGLYKFNFPSFNLSNFTLPITMNIFTYVNSTFYDIPLSYIIQNTTIPLILYTLQIQNIIDLNLGDTVEFKFSISAGSAQYALNAHSNISWNF